MDSSLKKEALEFHELNSPGKIQINSTKPLVTQHDLALAYSPGVAFPCLEIEKDPTMAYRYTSRGNLVAVISNGTAVLGLGNIGALAGKPVMEGKAVLFKKFAGIDVFDIEINENDVDKLVDIISSLEPTFGGINLEDIKAPDCFYLEKKLKEKMNIPVFHDDQHGTAIIAAAATLNSLEIVGKDISKAKLVCSGAGAAAIACLNLLLSLGLKKENVIVCDSKGVIHKNRNNLDEFKQQYIVEDNGIYTLKQAIKDADIFLGLSVGNVFDEEMLHSMSNQPIILALANPNPEVSPPFAKKIRPDAIICTGRSDYPNQVNNVLCFPYLFRGALDVGATTINEEMKLAAVRAIADLAKAEQSEKVAIITGKDLHFGPDYVIPSPFDPRLIIKIASKVAEAAMKSGVATKPIEDLNSYTDNLGKYVYKTTSFMRPIFSRVRDNRKKIVLCEGENINVLHALKSIIDLKIADPIIIGRKEVIESQIHHLGLKIKPDKDFYLYDLSNHDQYEKYYQEYYELNNRKGVNLDLARALLSANSTILGAMMVKNGDADGLICGAVGSFKRHFKILENIIGYDNPEKIACAINALMLSIGNIFITDTYVNEEPSAKQLAYIAKMAAKQLEDFGVTPHAAFLANSNFGSHSSKVTKRIRKALKIVKDIAPDLEIDGEMQGDVALNEKMRNTILGKNNLKGPANLLIMPNVMAANICYNLLRVSGSDGVTIGPILTGLAKSCYIITPISSPRRIVNIAAIAASKIK